MSIKTVKKLKKSTRARASVNLTTAPVPYVLKADYLQVVVGGRPYALRASHPTFQRLAAALRGGNWKAVPRLVSLAEAVRAAAYGRVTLKDGVVHYKGRPVHTELTGRILRMMKEAVDVRHMLRFMDNLYQNPEPDAVAEFYEWLRDNRLPITDDGCFLAYKSVDEDLKDEHTHAIDNRPGQTVWMPRAAADRDYRTQCSYGFHVCSRQYGFYGSRVMCVKVNPRDVLSAVEGKMRVLRYEVLRELGTKNENLFKQEGFTSVEKLMVAEVRKERRELVKALLRHSTVRRHIARGKLARSTVEKQNYAQTLRLAVRYGVVKPAPVEDGDAPATAVTVGEPPLRAARVAAGLTVGQVAKAMGVDYKTVALLEKKADPPRPDADRYLTAIADATGQGSLRRSAITFPVAVKKVKKAA